MQTSPCIGDQAMYRTKRAKLQSRPYTFGTTLQSHLSLVQYALTLGFVHNYISLSVWAKISARRSVDVGKSFHQSYRFKRSQLGMISRPACRIR